MALGELVEADVFTVKPPVLVVKAVHDGRGLRFPRLAFRLLRTAFRFAMRGAEFRLISESGQTGTGWGM